MRIATIVFTYNRSYHTEKTLEALKRNDLLLEKLFIFQDGLKCEEDREEWKKVKAIISSIDWCNNEVIERDINLGLSASIVSGINFVMKEYEAVIVLEDDCVTHPKFMRFVTDALEKFKDNRKVYQVSGYVWPVEVKENGTDAYFTGRSCSWGWATWKDRWAEYKQDYGILARIKRDKNLSKQFHIWGEDLESYLYGNITGQINSWAVFWSLVILEKGGYCLNPYESLIDNIGFDGSGVHCGNVKVRKKLRISNDLRTLLLPEIVEFPIDYEYAYMDCFSWTPGEVKLSCYYNILMQWIILSKNKKELAGYFIDRGINTIAVWGKGKICELLLKELNGKIKVLSIIESNPIEKYYFDIPVINIKDLPEKVQLIVIIPAYDWRKIKKKIDREAKCDVIAIDKLLESFLS